MAGRSRPATMLVLALAALLPLEAAHCAWMKFPTGTPGRTASCSNGAPARAPQATLPDPHACCRMSDAPEPAPVSHDRGQPAGTDQRTSPDACFCLELPDATRSTPPVIERGNESSAAAALADVGSLAIPQGRAPIADALATPIPPHERSARRLRAPPVG